MKHVVFDVGANSGSSTKHMAWRINDNPPYVVDTDSPECTTFRFEPIPKFAEMLRGDKQSNLVTIEAAVSDFEGESDFNIAGLDIKVPVLGFNDWGTSSLLEFSDKSIKEWGGNPFLKVTEKIKVKVIRLDRFIEEHGIKRIDYFHCDTQGSDLKVLKGMGPYVHLIRRGVVECANSGKDDILYTGQNRLDETTEFLKENGFSIESIIPNDQSGNEVNVYFQNNDTFKVNG